MDRLWELLAGPLGLVLIVYVVLRLRPWRYLLPWFSSVGRG